MVKHWSFHEVTNKCLNSLIALGEDFRITVIDGSSKKLPYLYTHPRIHVVPLEPNLGLIPSFNRFWTPDDDLTLCLNNDVIVSRNWMAEIIGAVNRNARIGIVATLCDDPNAGYLCRKVTDELPGSEEWHQEVIEKLKPLAQSHVYTRHVDNHAWGFTKALTTAIGLPDDRFKGAGWGANLDYCHRARERGFLVAMVLGGYVHHTAGVSYVQDPDYRRRSEEERDSVLRAIYDDPAVVW